MILLTLIAGGCIASLRKCWRWMNARPGTMIGVFGALWLMHTAVCWFTLGQILMFRGSIAIEMGEDQALKELLLLVKGCSSLLSIATGLLIVLTCIGLCAFIRRDNRELTA